MRRPEGKPLAYMRKRLINYTYRDQPPCKLWEGKELELTWRYPDGVLRTWLVIRAAYESFVGPIPAGQKVVQTCGRKYCINPEHLSLVDDTDGSQQPSWTLRVPTGAVEGKLTSADRSAILADPRTAKEIAADFGVTSRTVRNLKAGRSWRGLQTPPSSPPNSNRS
jgi:hypothetical protein